MPPGQGMYKCLFRPEAAELPLQAHRRRLSTSTPAHAQNMLQRHVPGAGCSATHLATRLHEEGCVLVSGLFDAPGMLADLMRCTKELETLNGPIQSLESVNGKTMPSRTEAFVDYHPKLNDVLRYGTLPKLLAELLGEDVKLYKEKVNYTPPHGGGGYPPHQDVYDVRALGVDPNMRDTSDLCLSQKYFTCFIAVDETSLTNGCLSVAPGYHRQGLRQHAPLPVRLVAEEEPHPSEWVQVPMQAGDVLIFDNYMPHKSLPNNSTSWRRAMFAVYNASSKGDHREEYYRRGRLPQEEGGTGRWAPVENPGEGPAFIAAGADGFAKPVIERSQASLDFNEYIPGLVPVNTAETRGKGGQLQ